MDKRTKEYKEFIKEHPQGLGDKLTTLFDKTGVSKLATKDCGCDQRRETLNKLFPVRYKAKRCFTDSEKEWYKDYYNKRTLNIVNKEQLKQIVKMHESIFNWRVNNLCHNCSGSASIIRGMVQRLDKMHLSY